MSSENKMYITITNFNVRTTNNNEPNVILRKIYLKLFQ